MIGVIALVIFPYVLYWAFVLVAAAVLSLAYWLSVSAVGRWMEWMVK